MNHAHSTRLVTWLAVGCILSAGAGCGLTKKMAVGTMSDIIDEATRSAWASNDPELVRDAVPANLLLLDGLIQTQPRDDLLIQSCMFHFAYGFAFIEDENPDRARGLYEKGRDYGLRVVRKKKAVARALDAADVAALGEALGDMKEKDLPALFWTSAAWAAWINLSLESPAAIADLALVEAMLQRVLELDESFQWGMPHLMMGAFYAGRSKMLGGDPERGREHFEQARRITGGRLLLASYFEARYYAVQTFDEELFERRLREVVDADAGALPEAMLLNTVAQQKAQDLLLAREDIF